MNFYAIISNRTRLPYIHFIRVLFVQTWSFQKVDNISCYMKIVFHLNLQYMMKTIFLSMNRWNTFWIRMILQSSIAYILFLNLSDSWCMIQVGDKRYLYLTILAWFILSNIFGLVLFVCHAQHYFVPRHIFIKYELELPCDCTHYTKMNNGKK